MPPQDLDTLPLPDCASRQPATTQRTAKRLSVDPTELTALLLTPTPSSETEDSSASSSDSSREVLKPKPLPVEKQKSLAINQNVKIAAKPLLKPETAKPAQTRPQTESVRALRVVNRHQRWYTDDEELTALKMTPVKLAAPEMTQPGVKKSISVSGHPPYYRYRWYR